MTTIPSNLRRVLRREPRVRPSTEPVAAPKSASKRLEQAGVGLFWGLVGVIVLARALYFEPGAFSFGGALAWAQGMVALF